MNPEDIAVVEEAPKKKPLKAEVAVEVARSTPEEPKTFWEEAGFLEEIGRVCENLENEPERFLFDSTTRHAIEVILNGRTVADFERYSTEQLRDFSQRLRTRVPEIERQVTSMINSLSRARTVQLDTVDFI